MFTKLIRKLFCLTILLTFFCAPVLAITQEEYAALMNNSAFASAHKRINELWDKVQRIAPQSVRDFLEQAQTEWWDYQLDSRANDFIEDDKLPREAAYTKATSERADDLQILLKALNTPVKPNKLIGEYVRTWDKTDTGWLNVKWGNKKKSEVKLELFAVGGGLANFGTDLWAPNMGEWEGRGVIKNRVLAISDKEFKNAHIIFVFQDNNTVMIETTSGFHFPNHDCCGLGVFFNGEYKRKKK